MKNYLLKTFMIIIFVIVIILNFSIQSKTYATDYEVITISKIDINPDDYKPEINSSDRFNSIVGSILGILQVLGIILMVIGIAIIGLKTILGSADEKAEYQGKTIGILVGAAIIFGISTITKFIISVIE